LSSVAFSQEGGSFWGLVSLVGHESTVIRGNDGERNGYRVARSEIDSRWWRGFR
jgi:hypothetical protein